MGEGNDEEVTGEGGAIPGGPSVPKDETRLEQTVRATTGRELYRTAIGVRQHELTVDEPAQLGGGDTGPSPLELVCAALASCTTITLRMYADRKAWPLEEIEARVAHARLRVERDGQASDVDRFTLTVGLKGELDEAQRDRLMQIAGRCPVHRLLVTGSVVEIREALSVDNGSGGGQAG